MLRILVVGCKREICRKAIIELLENHRHMLVYSSDCILDKEDNTYYDFITNVSCELYFRGRSYDQVIYVDDFRNELKDSINCELLKTLKELLARSNVPDKYLELNYEYTYTTREERENYYAEKRIQGDKIQGEKFRTDYLSE